MSQLNRGLPKKRSKPRLSEAIAGISEYELDKKFRKIIHARGHCEAADLGGCFGDLECSHRIKRGQKAVRWSEDNADCLCSTHHKLLGPNRELYRDFVGHEKWDELETYKGVSEPDLAEVNKRLSTRLKELTW